MKEKKEKTDKNKNANKGSWFNCSEKIKAFPIFIKYGI